MALNTDMTFGLQVSKSFHEVPQLAMEGEKTALKRLCTANVEKPFIYHSMILLARREWMTSMRRHGEARTAQARAT